MKTRLYKPILMSLLVGILFLTNSCQDIFTNPMKDKETGEDLTLLLLDPNFYDTRITVSLVDTAGNPFTAKKTFVAFLGDKAANIVDFNGSKNDYYTTTTGSLEVYVDPNIEISESDPFPVTVIIGIEDYSWYAFPYDFELVQKGYANVVITMFPFTPIPLKSAKLNPGNEPFDVKFNGELISSDNGWSISTYSQPDYSHSLNYMDGYTNMNKKYCSILLYNNGSLSGYLTADNLTIDQELISEYGIDLSVTPQLGNNRYFTNSFNIVPLVTSNTPPIFGPTFVYKPTYYTGYLRKDMEKCSSGININVVEKYGQKGTAKFSYKLKRKYSIAYDYQPETVQEGNLDGESLPFTANTGSFYYPVDPPTSYGGPYVVAYDNSIYLSISDDEQQYNIEPSEIKIDGDFCGQTVNVTAVPRSGLKPYKLITSYVCQNNPAGAAPTISGQFRVKGSKGNGTDFNFSGGIAILQLKPGTTYEIKGNAFRKSADFDFSTNESENAGVIATALKEIKELKDLSISFSEKTTATPDDDFIGTEIRIKATFKEGNCPL